MENREKWVPAMHGLVRDTPWPSPDIPGWVGLYPFKAWCLQTLPTIFDESMSYYELLCKLLHYIEGCLQDVQLLGEEFVKLKQFVENYFDSLDIQQEVNNKLDQMVVDGTMQELVNNYIKMNKGGQWTNYTGALVVGGKIASLGKVATGTPAAQYVVSQLGYNPIENLTSENYSLLTPGPNSYASVLQQWKNNNQDYYERGYRLLFVSLDREILNYDLNIVQNAIAELHRIFNGRLWLRIIPHLLSNTTFDYKDFVMYRRVQDLVNINGVVINTPTTPPYADNEAYYTDENTLSREGIYRLSTRLFDSYYQNRLLFNVAQKSYALTNGYVNIRFRESFYYSQLWTFGFNLFPNTDEEIDIGILYVDLLTWTGYSVNQHMVFFSYSNGKLKVKTDETWSSEGESGYCSVMVPLIL